MLNRGLFVPVIVLGALILLTGSPNPFGVPPPVSSLPTLEKVVALTFDDGPSEYTSSILGVLRKTNTKATFFVLGEDASRYPSVVQEMARDGNEVENHSWSHPHLLWRGVGFLRAQLEETTAVIEKLTGKKPRFFRPPYGQYHLVILQAVNRLGLSTVVWNTTAYDWINPGAERIQSNVLGGLKPGAIILLHDGGGNREQTVAALSGIITQAQARGWRFVLLRDYLR